MKKIEIVSKIIDKIGYDSSKETGIIKRSKPRYNKQGN